MARGARERDASAFAAEATLDDDADGADLVGAAITTLAYGPGHGQEVIAGARARRAVHGACRYLTDDDARRAVRDEVAPWLLGLRDPLAR